jgi:hypothetical protein
VKYGICRYLLALVNDEILTSIYVNVPILTIISNVKYGICRYLLALVNDEILTSIYVYVPALFPFSERPLWNFLPVVWVAVTALFIFVCLRCLLTVRVLLLGASLSTSMALAFVAVGSPSCNQFVFSFSACVFFSLCYCSRGW